MLDALAEQQRDVPIDVAHEYLLQTAHRMERRFRSVGVRPIERNFLSAFEIRTGMSAGRRVGFFSSSTTTCSPASIENSEATFTWIESVSVGQRRFHFREDEIIHTESSRKYDRETFRVIVERAGWSLTQARENDRLFCIFALSAQAAARRQR